MLWETWTNYYFLWYFREKYVKQNAVFENEYESSCDIFTSYVNEHEIESYLFTKFKVEHKFSKFQCYYNEKKSKQGSLSHQEIPWIWEKF